MERGKRSASCRQILISQFLLLRRTQTRTNSDWRNLWRLWRRRDVRHKRRRRHMWSKQWRRDVWCRNVWRKQWRRDVWCRNVWRKQWRCNVWWRHVWRKRRRRIRRWRSIIVFDAGLVPAGLAVWRKWLEVAGRAAKIAGIEVERLLLKTRLKSGIKFG
jgi:hypothetical protein